MFFAGTEPVAGPKDKELVHIILPLSGRTATFQSFMEKFVKIGLKNDRRVHLTVVYFGEEGLSEARAIMSRVLMTRNSGGNANNLRLLALNETFSRGKGLRVGAERVPGDKKDVLLFMCDVDVVFSARFLDRCRWNTKPGKRSIIRWFLVCTIPMLCIRYRGGAYPQRLINLSSLETRGFGEISDTG